jgi:ribonuclease HI
MNYTLMFDGACTWPPESEASYGFVLYESDREIDSGYGIVGRGKYMTELVGEYAGLNAGLDSFIRHWNKPQASLRIAGDSKVAIGNVKKKIHEREDLQIIRRKLDQIIGYGVKVRLEWIPRDQNHIADALAKKLRAFPIIQSKEK